MAASKRPHWSKPGAWAFVYETGTARAAKMTSSTLAEAFVLPVDAYAALKTDGKATWLPKDAARALVLKREYAAPIRVMVGGTEEVFSALGARGRGVMLYVLADARCPIILQREQAGMFTTLVEIVAK